jgi:hypothetical protein
VHAVSHPHPATITEVATWLLEEIERRGGSMDEDTAAIELVRLFGADFCDIQNNRFVVARRVRDELTKVATTWPRELAWDQRARTWRLKDRSPPYR